jgi:hypothetical protein
VGAGAWCADGGMDVAALVRVGARRPHQDGVDVRGRACRLPIFTCRRRQPVWLIITWCIWSRRRNSCGGRTRLKLFCRLTGNRSLRWTGVAERWAPNLHRAELFMAALTELSAAASSTVSTIQALRGMSWRTATVGSMPIGNPRRPRPGSWRAWSAGPPPKKIR